MSETAVPGLFDRALRRLASVWRDMAAGAGADQGESLADLMRDCLQARGGEVSPRARAARLAEAYLGLDAAGRFGFLGALAGFDSDADAVAAAYEAVLSAPDPAAAARARAGLRRALEPPRVRLLTQFTTIPDGMKFLVDLRAALLDGMGGDPVLAALESDLKGLLRSWFDVGMLELVRIDWSSPAALLERLVAYEAVHSIRSWSDLKNRLDSDRRCYALFHPRMPGEPLIFVEVALTQGLASSVQRLLDKRAPVLDPKLADTAIFYSISNCQRGLAGISLGNFLIKHVVDLLAREFALRQFATLSPAPGFRSWLDAQLAAADGPGNLAANLLSDEESAALRTAAPADAPACETGAQALAAILRQRGWQRDVAMVRATEPPLMRLCARYLLVASGGNGARALDPVAHFHLSNGARVERLNMLGDTSEKGARESATIMVNYLYDPVQIEDCHEAYVGEGKRAASTGVRRLARGWT
jgi:malonyl-CoA decarboxylase